MNNKFSFIQRGGNIEFWINYNNVNLCIGYIDDTDNEYTILKPFYNKNRFVVPKSISEGNQLLDMMNKYNCHIIAALTHRLISDYIKDQHSSIIYNFNNFNFSDLFTLHFLDSCVPIGSIQIIVDEERNQVLVNKLNNQGKIFDQMISSSFPIIDNTNILKINQFVDEFVKEIIEKETKGNRS